MLLNNTLSPSFSDTIAAVIGEPGSYLASVSCECLTSGAVHGMQDSDKHEVPLCCLKGDLSSCS